MENNFLYQYQYFINKWKENFNILWFWDIKAIHDGENFCQIKYNVKNRVAVIYPCDIENTEDYIIHEIVKLAMIASTTQEEQLTLIEDICSLIIK